MPLDCLSCFAMVLRGSDTERLTYAKLIIVFKLRIFPYSELDAFVLSFSLFQCPRM